MVEKDPIARIEVGRLTVADVDRWHARARANGVGESSLRNQHLVLRAGMTQAARWGWVPTNVVALATPGRRKTQPRSALSPNDVRAAIAAAEQRDPAAGLALRLAAITGARRAELCALRWTDCDGDRLTIDSSIEIVREGSVTDKRTPILRDAATKTANRSRARHPHFGGQAGTREPGDDVADVAHAIDGEVPCDGSTIRSWLSRGSI